MRRPILHIGYHKTGTTWLQVEGFRLLEGVERIHGPDAKALLRELATGRGEFAPEKLRSLIEKSEACHPLISYEFLSGQVFNGSQHGTRTAHRLAEALPEAMTLIVVRRQPEMLESLHAQYVNQGGTVSFPNFLAGSGHGFDLNPEHLEYDRLVSTYVDLFGEPNVLVLPYELLRARPEAFLDRLADALGTKVTGNMQPRTVNPSLSGKRLDILRTWNRWFRRSQFNPDPIIPLPKAAKMRRLMQGRSRPRLELQDLSVTFSERYGPSNQRLQAWCDLSGWGYPGVG